MFMKTKIAEKYHEKTKVHESSSGLSRAGWLEGDFSFFGQTVNQAGRQNMAQYYEAPPGISDLATALYFRYDFTPLCNVHVLHDLEEMQAFVPEATNFPASTYLKYLLN